MTLCGRTRGRPPETVGLHAAAISPLRQCAGAVKRYRVGETPDRTGRGEQRRRRARGTKNGGFVVLWLVGCSATPSDRDEELGSEARAYSLQQMLNGEIVERL